MGIYPDLFVLRHGQTLWNAAGRHQGRLNSELTETGRQQARRQGRILAGAGLDAGTTDFYVSPLGRARQTADLALGVIGQSALVDERLKEIGFGGWEGLNSAEIDARWPENRQIADRFDWHFSAPGGEGFDSLFTRARSFLDDLAGASVIVTHGITSRVLRGIWLGLDRDGMGRLEGGQGMVYHLAQRRQTRLD